MLNNRSLRALFIKITAASFILTLVIAAPYISRRAPEIIRSLTKPGDNKVVENTTQASTGNSDGDELANLMGPKKASGKQVKPSFDSLPVELFSSNQAFALDFHKLPVDYLVPQAPESTRNALAMIKQLRDADLKAFAAQKEIAGIATLSRESPAESSPGGKQ